MNYEEEQAERLRLDRLALECRVKDVERCIATDERNSRFLQDDLEERRQYTRAIITHSHRVEIGFALCLLVLIAKAFW